MMDCEVRNDKVIVKLGTYLERENASAQIGFFKRALSYNKPILFQASEIHQIDTSSLQVLLSFTHLLGNKSLEWEWDGPSDVLKKMAETLDIHKQLKLNAC